MDKSWRTEICRQIRMENHQRVGPQSVLSARDLADKLRCMFESDSHLLA